MLLCKLYKLKTSHIDVNTTRLMSPNTWLMELQIKHPKYFTRDRMKIE